MEQMSLFDFTRQPFKVDRPIRVISAFAGIGSVEMALRDLGAKFEHYRVYENDPYAIQDYNNVHGTSFEPTDICDVKGSDLGICDKDRYAYLLSYTYPCQDISLAGKRAGMAFGTRSSLLWEIKRLLNETDELPQILLMENVKAAIGEGNLKDFKEWSAFLESKGYSNYMQVLQTADYGVPQSRERVIMISLLGEYVYHFPEEMELRECMADRMENEVHEKYFINTEKARQLIEELIEKGELPPENFPMPQ